MFFELFNTHWPWMGLGMAIIVFILLFFTNTLRSNTKLARYKDPRWVAWFGTFAYMLHNFEEYGIDLSGTAYAFPTLMYNTLGITPPALTFTAINVGLVWIASSFLAYMCGKGEHPVMAMSMTGLLLTNALSHIASLAAGGYNSGVGTGIVIFIPAALIFYYHLVVKGPYSWSALIASICVPVIAQIVLMGSLMLFKTGAIGDTGIVAIQICNIAVMIGCAWIFEKILKDRMYSKK